jgi:hypothetical protein
MTDVMENVETAVPSFVWAPEIAKLSQLASVAASSSDDQARPIFTNIHLFTRQGEIVAEATDSYTLARVSVPVEGNADLDVLIPAQWLVKSLSALKLKGRAALTQDVLVNVAGGMVTLSSGGLTLSTVLGDGRFPQIDHLIPAESNYQSELGAFHAPYLARMAKILPPVVKGEGTWECVSMSATRPSLWRRIQHYDARPREDWTATALFLQMPVRIK